MDLSRLYSIFLNHPDVCTDTRSIRPGCIFFALQGPNFNGNNFALHALDAGAAYAVVSDPSLSDERFIHVDDTLAALQGLANHHRRQFLLPVIAITGSNGKTTTKELILSVLSKKYNVLATVGNLNNHIGVPLTLLRLHHNVEIALIEMGANHIGEIRQLCEMAMPTHGIITNIGKAHLEGFGSIEGVQKAKSELFDYLHAHEGFSFINADDTRLAAVGQHLIQKTTYGLNSQTPAEINFTFESDELQQNFTLINEELKIPSTLFGQYNASNMVAAYAVGRHFDVDVNAMIDALSTFKSGANRSEIITHRDCIIIKDAYNANPSSMELAVRAFAARYTDGWIVLGDMKELGDASEDSHQHMLEVISALGIRNVVLIGREFTRAADKIKFSGPGVQIADNMEDIRKEWAWEKLAGKAVLLKGSRSMQLEKLLEF